VKNKKRSEKLKKLTFLLAYVEKNKKGLKSIKRVKIKTETSVGERKEINSNYHALMGTSTHTNVHSEAPDQDRPVNKFSVFAVPF
jgi:hypothetical protein